MSCRSTEEVRWRRAVEQGAFGVWDLDPHLEQVHYAPAWKARLGFPRIHAADPTGFWRCRVHPQDADAMLQSLRAHVDGFTSSYSARFRLRSNGSGYRTVLSRGRVVGRDAHGRATRMVGTMIDLTDRPAVAATHGLPADEAAAEAAPATTPFHALLGVGQGEAPAPGGGAAPLLLAQLSDLLEIALRETGGAPLLRARR